MKRGIDRSSLSWLAFACAAAVLVSCNTRRDPSPGVELKLSTEEFQADSTFELRFETDMVPPSAVGSVATTSPLRIEPMLKGSFTWLSPRSGVFTPSEPPLLDTSYLFRLSSGLQTSDGRASKVRLRQRLHTPAFGVTDLRANYNSTNKVAPMPVVLAEFNAAVNPESLSNHCSFSNGQITIAAQIQPQTNRYKHHSQMHWEVKHRPGRNTRTWNETFDDAQAKRRAETIYATPPPPVTPAAHLFHIQPARPLPAGPNWSLTFASGLPAKSNHLRLQQDRTVTIGTVRLIEVSSARPVNTLERGKYIELKLSDSLGWQFGGDRLAEFIQLVPPVENMRVAQSWRSVRVYGDFATAASAVDRHFPAKPQIDLYRLSLRAPAHLKLIADYEGTFKFEPLAPQVRFPAYSIAQTHRGEGAFRMLTVNAAKVDIRAKRMTPETLIHTLRGYRDTYRSGGWSGSGKLVPFNLVPGIGIGTRGLKAGGFLDEAVELRLNLHELLNGKPGPIFIEATASPQRRGTTQRTQSVLQFTDLGMIWKRHSEGIQVFVFSHQSGKPISQVQISIMNDDNQALYRTHSDRQGIARIAKDAIGSISNSLKSPRWLVAEHGDDLHALELKHNSLSRYGFDIATRWDVGREDEPRVFLFSDRTAYRPGEEVRIKALGRLVGTRISPWPSEKYAQQAKFQLFDPRGQLWQSGVAPVSRLGSADWQVTLPEDRPGRYRLRLDMGHAGVSKVIHVQEFKPDAFEVSLSDTQVGHVGDAMSVDLKAAYFLGKELSNAKVRWTASAKEFRPQHADLPKFVFGSTVRDRRLRPGTQNHNQVGEGVFSSTTNFVIAPSFNSRQASPYPRRIQIRANVTDQNQRTVSAETGFVEHSSEFYLGVELAGQVLPAGSRLNPRIIALDSQMQPLTNHLDVTVKLHSLKWHSVRIQGAGKTKSYRNEFKLTEVLTTNAQTQIPYLEGIKWRVPDPENTLIDFSKPGQFLLEVSAKDSAGRQVLTAYDFNVAGTNESVWDYRNETRVELVPDRKIYRPGDRARILVKTPIGGHALVSKERYAVHQSFHQAIVGNAPAIEFDITTNDAPNVFASFTMVRGAGESQRDYPMPEFRYGYCELKVEDSSRRLKVALQTTEPSYRPGTKVKIKGLVTDGLDHPIPGAEVTLYAVDEGVLSLTAYQTPDPFGFFHQDQPLAVATHLSLQSLLSDDPAELRYGNKGYIAGGGGRLGGRPRSNFVPCPLWLPKLITDDEGRIQAEFTAPDNLTKYRIIAIAHADAGRFGDGETSVRINKPLMIEPVLPAFARRGDRIQAQALIINRTETAGRVKVSWYREGQRRTAGPDEVSQTINLSGNETRTVEFPLEFTTSGEAKWTWEAQFLEGPQKGIGDAVVSELLVEEPMPSIREIFVGQVHSETNLLAPADPALLMGRGTATVRLSTSPLLQTWEATDYLMRYPYGCLEQTASSMVPWMLLHSDPGLAALTGRSRADAEKAVIKGINRLLSMQTSAGGFSYWPGSRTPQIWTSAYGGMMLLRAQQAGFDVPPQALEQVLSYLRREIRGGLMLNKETAEVGGNVAFALYTLALSGQGETSYYTRLTDRAEQIGAASRALLALSILHSYQARHWQDLARKLLETDGRANIRTWNYFGAPARTAALELMAWRKLGDSKMARELEDHLLSARENGHWLNTQGNAWVLMAFADDARASADAVIKGSLTWGGQSQRFELPKTARAIEFPLAAQKQGLPLVLSFDSPSETRLFAHLRVSSQLEKLPEPMRERGFRLSRHYEEVNGLGELSPATDLEIGDTVLVTLNFSSDQDASYVAIDDALPAAFAAVQSAFRSRGANGKHLAETWTSDHQELRNDRAVFFKNYLPRGEHRIRYLAQVRASGASQAPPARIEEMYRPNRHGLSKPTKIQSRR
jgi:alpha-2-macroglobulin